MAKQTIANTPEADSASMYIGADANNKWVKVRGYKLATKAQLDEVEQVADDAKTMATTAKGTAETADSKATDAKSIASDAGRLAGTANSNAIDAKNKATAAQTAAENAASAATAAQTAATNAQNAANDAGTAAATATQKATEAVVAANSVTGDINKIWGRMREIYTPEMTEQHDYPVSALWFYNGLTVPTSAEFPTNTAGTYDSVFIPTGNGASEVKLRVKGLSYAEDAVFSVLAMCQKLTLYAENTELGYITRGAGAKTFGWLCFSVRIVQGGIFAITEMANCTFTLTYAGTEYSVLVPSSIDSALSNTSENPVQNKVVTSALNAKAPLESPTFTGTPTAPTQPNDSKTNSIATTKFVDNILSINPAANTSYHYGIREGTSRLKTYVDVKALFTNLSAEKRMVFMPNELYITGNSLCVITLHNLTGLPDMSFRDIEMLLTKKSSETADIDNQGIWLCLNIDNNPIYTVRKTEGADFFAFNIKVARIGENTMILVENTTNCVVTKHHSTYGLRLAKDMQQSLNGMMLSFTQEELEELEELAEPSQVSDDDPDIPVEGIVTNEPTEEA